MHMHTEDFTIFSLDLNFARCLVVSSPDPTLCEGKGLVTVERFLGFCKLSSRVFA